MSKEDKGDVFGGFDAIFDSIVSSTGKTSDDSKYPIRGAPVDDDVDDDVSDEPDNDDVVDDDIDDSSDDQIDDRVDDEPDTVDESDDAVSVDVDIDDDEKNIVSPFVDLFAKELGWEFDEDVEAPGTIQELVDYMSDIIEANSKPIYFSEDIEKLDEFVKAGGSVDDFFRTKYGEVDYNTIDLNNEDNQKLVIKELLKVKGFSEDRIEKKINTYEDAGVLKEESEDAAEILAEDREKAAKKLLEDQGKLHQEYLKKQQNFSSDVKSLIDETNNVRGVPISKKERELLKDYIFKVDNDGKTQYQKEYAKSYQNLVESAYFTMKGDSLVKDIKSKAQSDAITEFKKNLKSKPKVNKSNINKDVSLSKDTIVGTISKALINPR